MNVKVKAITASRKTNRLADASIELTDSEGDLVVISDIRILQNKQGEVWIAMPSRSVSLGGRSFEYFPQVESNKRLQRKIQDVILAAFEQWQQSRSASEVR